jgi:antitoxin CptB
MKMSENQQDKVRRLIYQSCYTGTRETDTLLCGFAKEKLPEMDAAELESYEALLELGDPAIWAVISGQLDVPANLDTKALDLFIAHVKAR